MGRSWQLTTITTLEDPSIYKWKSLIKGPAQLEQAGPRKGATNDPSHIPQPRKIRDG